MEFSDNSPSDFKVTTPSWPQLTRKWEAGLTGLYYPNLTVIQIVIEPAEFWTCDQTEAVNLSIDNVSDVIEIFDPVEDTAINVVNINDKSMTSAAFKKYTLSPNNYRLISKVQRNLTANFQNHFALRLSDDPHDGVRHYYQIKLELDDNKQTWQVQDMVW